MLDFTWELFSQTGNIETYLLYKQFEEEKEATPENEADELTSIDPPIL